MEDTFVKERERTRIPDKYKWSLTDISPDDDTWAAAKQKLVTGFPALSAYQGKLAESPAKLFECLQTADFLRKECTRLACYASMKSDVDTRETAYLAMDQEMGQIGF